MPQGTLKHLEQDFENIFKNIEHSQDERVQWLYEKLNETRQMMAQFRSDHNQMARELRAFLKKNKLDRLKNFNHFFNGLVRENARKAKETQDLLSGYQTSYQNMRRTYSEFQRRINPKKVEAQRLLSAHSKSIPQFYVPKDKK